MTLGTAARNAALAAIQALINAGTGTPAGALVLFQGRKPTNPQTAPSGSTVLAVIPLRLPAFLVDPPASIALDTPDTAAATAAGTLQWGRYIDRDTVSPYNTGVMDIKIGVTGDSTADITLDSVTVAVGTNIVSLAHIITEA